jgi:hypothetical protein
MQRVASLIQILRFVFSKETPLLARIVGVVAIGYTLMPFTWGPLGILDNLVVPLLAFGLIRLVLNRSASVPRAGEDSERAKECSGEVIDVDYRMISDDMEDLR